MLTNTNIKNVKFHNNTGFLVTKSDIREFLIEFFETNYNLNE